MVAGKRIAYYPDKRTIHEGETWVTILSFAAAT